MAGSVHAEESGYSLDIRYQQVNGAVVFSWDDVPRSQWPAAGPGGDWTGRHYTAWAWKFGESWPYNVHFCDGSIRDPQATGWPNQTNTECVIDSLEPGVTYNFAVVAVAFNDGLHTAQILHSDLYAKGGVTVCCGEPGAPREIRLVDLGAGSALAAWTPPEQLGGANGVTYEVSLFPGGEKCVTQDESCTFERLDFGTEYMASVASVTSGGKSEAVASVPLILRAPKPKSPRNVKARIRSDDVVVSWRPPKADATSGAYRYRVVSDPGNRQCTTRRVRCRIKGLEAGRTYVFEVFAISRGGGRSSSVASNSVLVAEIPQPPQQPSLPAPQVPSKPGVPLS